MNIIIDNDHYFLETTTNGAKMASIFKSYGIWPKKYTFVVDQLKYIVINDSKKLNELNNILLNVDSFVELLHNKKYIYLISSEQYSSKNSSDKKVFRLMYSDKALTLKDVGNTFLSEVSDLMLMIMFDICHKKYDIINWLKYMYFSLKYKTIIREILSKEIIYRFYLLNVVIKGNGIKKY